MAFQLSRTKVFEVNYHMDYFSTAAAELCRNKRDYSRCGQCQEDILPGYGAAMNFYAKWDRQHLKRLSPSKYAEMLRDLDVLKSRYNYAIDDSQDLNFSEIVELSKKKVKP
jgi:hypothetical protein